MANDAGPAIIVRNGDKRRCEIVNRVAVVTTVEADTVDAANALHEAVREAWPEVSLKILATSRVSPIQRPWDVVDVESVNKSPFVVSKVLSEKDQLSFALPALISRLLDDYDTCLFVGPGLLMVRPPTELIEQTRRLGAGLVVPATVTPAYSLTPSLGPLEAGPFLPDTRCVAVSQSGDAFLEHWLATVEEAVIDVDQRAVTWAAETFIQRAIARSDIAVDGETTFLHWPDYAAVEVGRARGPDAAIVGCDTLFSSARDAHLHENVEVAWSLLIHKVHDSRPVEPLLKLIEMSQELRDKYQGETYYDYLRAAIWRSVDPRGIKWGHDSTEEFDEWLFERNDTGCTRIADLIVNEYPGLSDDFFRARHQPRPLMKWINEEGLTKLGFDPFDRSYEPRPIEVEPKADISRLLNALTWRWETVKRLVPGHELRVKARKEIAALGPDPAKARGVAAPRYRPVHREIPMWGKSPRQLNLIGPFRSESGLGQAARASLGAVRLLGRSFTHIDTTEKYPSRNAVDVGLDPSSHGQIGDVNLIHTNADEMITMASGAFKHRFGGRFNAAMWFWEPADLPRRSQPAFHLVDELWVASEYQRDVFGQYAKVPIHVVGLSADLPARRDVDRSRFGWREDELVFLFVYDALSSYGRKNPDKAISAFIEAFAPDFADVRFVLKVSNLNKFPASQKELLGLAEAYPAITVIDAYLTRDEVMDLMAASDVYVSLHAAEGFGLTILEAMALGTPPICTAYSGNMDFTNEENSWLVDYHMMRTEEQTGPYPEGSVWASPSLDDAIETMRHISENRSEIKDKAGLARRDALEAASLEHYAQRLDQNLRRVL